MSLVDLIMPKMGESIMEATILKWTKKPGDQIDMDETVLEIATDKVDSEIPSPVAGKLAEILFKEGDVVEIGKIIARIETEAGKAIAPAPTPTPESKPTPPAPPQPAAPVAAPPAVEVPHVPEPEVTAPAPPMPAVASSNGATRFYSPLVKSIAAKENLSAAELASVPGTGSNGRVTKKDIVQYLSTRSAAPTAPAVPTAPSPAQPAQAASTTSTPAPAPTAKSETPAVSVSGGEEIVQMDRMRKMIADHMVMSKRTSPHVTSFIEADVTDIVNWRNSVKADFQKKHGEKITYTPIFMQAVIKALQDFPGVNVSVKEDKIIMKKNLNLGMATALPSGNLIVPVIKNADYLNLVGLAKMVNDLARRARKGALKPDEVSGGTFTITNVGTFGNVMGTPIINQPQVAILAVGAIRKKPAVLETPQGDVIAIRHMMFLSLSYDHRVVDGMMGGSFLRRIGDYLEDFDVDQKI
jgi:2-oxoglutarate dehydrogenase E2 component (dihydrolipoamide succinyltransferase)